MDNKAQTIGQGFLVLAMSNIVVKLLSLIFVPIIRLTLGGDAAYSVYSSAYSVYALVYVLATAGFPTAISKLISSYTNKHRSLEAKRSFIYSSIITISASLFLSILVACLCKPIARFMNNEESWAGILHLAPTIFVCGLLSCIRGYFQGRKNMRPTALSQMFEQVVHLVMSLNMVYLLKGKGIVWAVAGASLGTLFGAIASTAYVAFHFYLERGYFEKAIIADDPIRLKEKIYYYDDRRIFKDILRFAMPVLLAAAVQYGGDFIDSKMIKGALISSGLLEESAKILHGQYMAMRQLINVPGALATALCVSVMPAISSSYAGKDFESVSKNTQFSIKLCNTVVIPIACVYAVFSTPIYKILGYGDNNILLTLCSFSCILLCTVHLQSSILQGIDRVYTSSIYMILCVVLKMVLNYILIRIPSINIYGAIIATYVSYLIPMILNFVAIKKEKVEFNYLQSLYPSLISSCISVAVSFGFYALIRFGILFITNGILSYLVPFVFAGLLFLFVYYFIMRKINGISNDDIKQVSGLFSKVCSVLDRILGIRRR